MKTVVVTGAGSGLGREVGRAFLAAGWRVVGVGRSAAHLEASAAGWDASPEHYRLVPLDVTHEAGVQSLFEQEPETEAVVHAAGVVQYGSVLELDSETFRRVLEINALGSFHVLRAAAKVMTPRRAGHIVLVASVAGLRGLDHMAAYSASKFAVRGLSQAAGLELRRFGIRVTCLCPGQIDTPMLGGGEHPSAMSPAKAAELILALAQTDPTLEVRELYVEPLGLDGA